MTQFKHSNEREIDLPPAPSPARSECGEWSVVRLDGERTAQYLDYLIRMLSQLPAEHSSLEHLREGLEHACWLGRWKRDDVTLEVDPGMFPELLQSLLQLSGLNQSREDLDTLEELLGIVIVETRFPEA